MNRIVFDICITAILVSLISLLIPNNKFSKQIKLMLSCFFIISVGSSVNANSCISVMDTNIIDDAKYNDYSSEINIMTAEKISENISNTVKAKLYEMGEVSEKIGVDVNISKTGSISINEIIIYMNADSYAEKSDNAAEMIREYYDNKISVKTEVDT